MKVIAEYIFGSENSLDVDKLYILDDAPLTIKDCKDVCNSLEDENDNANLATIKDGHIDWCYKGTIDELNNSIFRTYNLHEQKYPLMITGTVDRDVYLKMIRTVRVILSHFSRSQYRTTIKDALKGCWSSRLEAIKYICNFSFVSDETGTGIDLNTLNKNMSAVDVMKLIAFQIGQTKALIYGKELFTKNEVANEYPVLAPYLMRNPDSWIPLRDELKSFIGLLASMSCYSCYKERYVLFGSDANERNQNIYDLKLEKKITPADIQCA